MQGLEDYCFSFTSNELFTMVFQPSLSMSGLLGVSKLLLVIILAARF